MPLSASSTAGVGDHANAGFGPGEGNILSIRVASMLTKLGPLRHPRPMTASDLHLVLEKEQEAVVCCPIEKFIKLHVQIS